VLVPEQAGQALGLVAVEPVVDGIGIAGPQQPLEGHRMGAASAGDLEQGRTAFADIRSRVVVAELLEFFLLGAG
jgi:hypothetical protein